MKNLTVAVPDDVYRTARIRAAERGTSVSALVADYLRSLDSDAAEFQRLASLQASIVAELAGFRGADRLDREGVHDRAVL